jgi:hypothetical protein
LTGKCAVIEGKAVKFHIKPVGRETIVEISPLPGARRPKQTGAARGSFKALGRRNLRRVASRQASELL